MTEGIIQKVFSRHIDDYARKRNDSLLEAIQQELIEKIKQQSRGYFDSYEKIVKLEDLIGDNK